LQKQTDRKIADDSVRTSAAMAMQNFLLVAHERGLGTRVKDGIKFLTNFEDLQDEFYEEFQVPKAYQLISGIQLGYPTQEALKRNVPKRLPIEQMRKII
jgi:nitroreductase